MFRSFLRLFCLLVFWSSLAHSVMGHQVDTVEFEFQQFDEAWRLEGLMDIAYMLPETRAVPGGKPISRKAIMNAPPKELERIRRETENTLRKIIRLTFAGKEVGWSMRFPDFDQRPFKLPEEYNDWGLLTVVLNIDPQPGPGELVVHWSQKEKAELIILIEENTEYPRIVSVRAGGQYTLLEVEGSGEAVANNESTFMSWVTSGYRHVLPFGLDHTLFIFGLFLMSLKWRPLMWQSLLFTLSHSLTLALSVLGWVSLDPRWIEIAIAFSIAFIGIENLVSKKVGKLRYFLVFTFGLLHGMGFANVLADKVSQVSPSQLTEPLVGFNLGVELAQLSVIAISFLLFLPLKKKKRVKIAQVMGSLLVTFAGLGWMIERIFFA